MKHFLLFAVLLLSGWVCAETPELSGQAKITFENVVHDFGSFSESLGQVTCRFVFRNTGDGPLVVTKATASCGCTKPKYPEFGIAPGDTGSIAVTYNAEGRPGSFAKSVYVYGNTIPERTTLTIKGHVISTQKTINSEYNYSIKNLSLKSKSLPFYDTFRGEKKTNSIAIQNSGTELMVLAFDKVPKHLLVKADPEMLNPGEKGIIEITYDTEKTDEWGMQKDIFYIKVPGEKENTHGNKITVTANIIENFGKLTEKELEKSPKIELEVNKIDLRVTSRSPKRIVLNIKNNGKGKLVLRKVSCAECKEISLNLPKNTISPGKTGKLTVDIDPAKLSSTIINRRIMLICNDPARPMILIPVTGVIKQ